MVISTFVKGNASNCNRIFLQIVVEEMEHIWNAILFKTNKKYEIVSKL